MRILANWLVSALSLLIVSSIVPGIVLADFASALLAAVIIGFVNAVLRPVFILLTLPFTILTFGLFIFVVNALLLLFAGWLSPGFQVSGFGSALVGSILLSVVSTVFNWIIRSPRT
jgi:putative membrane protein